MNVERDSKSARMWAGRTSPVSRGYRGEGLRACLATLSLLVGCSGGGGGNGGGNPRSTPEQGTPTTAGLRFQVVEDRALTGSLSDPTAPPELANRSFSLQSSTVHGELVLGSDDRSFEYVPDADFTGVDGFDFLTADGRSLRATIDVTPVPDDPSLSLEIPLIAERGEPFSRQLSATDPDGESLRFSARELPPWLSLDAETGVLSGTPGEDAAERVSGIAFAVVDPTGRRFDLSDVELEVVAPSTTPRFDLSRLPADIDGGSNITVAVLPRAVSLEQVSLEVSTRDHSPGQGTLADEGRDLDLDIETSPPLSGEIRGREVILTAEDVNEVASVDVILSLTDLLGEVTRAVVPMKLLPRNASRRGRTLLGRRDGRGLNVVVFGDGYRDDQQDRLLQDTRRFIETLRADDGIADHLDAFNIHVVQSISEQEGIDRGNSGDERNTLYDSTYGCLNVPQLICTESTRLYADAISEYGDVDQVILFINDSAFGGSGNNGGAIAIASRTHAAIAVHEMGHSLAGLADEYVDGELVSTLVTNYEEGKYPNVTTIDDPVRVPWARWVGSSVSDTALGEGPVGVYEGALYRASGFYRPTQSSRMRDFEVPFGPVNAEQWVLAVYKGIGVVRDFQPQQRRGLEIGLGDTQQFSVEPFFPPDVQSIAWFLDDQRIRAADDARRFEIAPAAGVHRVRLEVRDVSGRIRIEPPHEAQFDWEWEIEVR